MSTLQIPAWDRSGAFNAYVAMPENLPAPTVIMIQEIFGVNQEMRDKCDELAAKGYIGVCPDLFWRLEPGVDLTDKSDEEWQKAFDLMNRFDIDSGIGDLRATVHTFKGHAECTGKVGTVGYCLGGKLAYLLAAHSHVDCTVSYYGVGLEELTNQADRIEGPVMLHIAEEDEYVSKDAQEKIRTALEENDLFTIHSYPGVNHAFARNNGVHYDANAAQSANERTEKFLEENLKQK